MKLARGVESAVFYRAAGTEVDICLVRMSPEKSWTRGAWMTLTGADGRNALEHAS